MSEDEEFEFRLRLEREQGAKKPTPSMGELFKRELLGSGPAAMVRGVKDVIDTGAQGLARVFGGKEEADRVRAMNDAGKAEFAEATQGRVLPQIGRVAGNLALTIPAAQAVGGAVSLAAPRLGAAISSAGMRTGAAPAGLAGRAADLGIRTAGGAVAGGMGATMVNPEDAGMGAAIGAATPGVIGAAGALGQGVGRMLRGPEQTPQLAQAVQSARDLGLVVPPSQARGTLGNRLLEGMAGKLTTAQNASAKNAPKVAEIVARDLGIPEGVPLNTESIGAVKKAAGSLYEAVSSAGTVTPGAGYQKALDAIAAPHVQAAKGFPNAKPSSVLQLVDSLRSEQFDAAAAVAKLKELRSAADDAFKPGGAGADVGRASKAAARALEDALEAHLKSIGEPALLSQFRDARQLYAKAATVEKAMDAVTGTVDARKLAAELQKGKPLSGEVRKVAEAAAQFKTAFKPPEAMGSLPQLSPLDWAVGGGLGAGTGNPLAMLAIGARPAARAAALSPMVQNRLVQPVASQSVANPLAALIAARSAPLIGADR